MKPVLWGYYGVNYGDNMMLETLLSYLEKLKGDVLLIDLFSRGRLAKKYSIFEKIKVIDVYSYSKLEKGKLILKLSSKKYINIWGGGTIFTDEDGDGNFGYFSKIKLLGGNIAYLGIGIGHLSKTKRVIKTKWLLKLSNLVTFRDQSSLKRADLLVGKRNCFYKVEDLVYLYIYRELTRKKNFEKEKNKYTLITWRNLNNYISYNDESKLMDIVVDCLLKANLVDKVILCALDINHDIESCKLLSNKFKKVGINVIEDFNNSIDHITHLIQYANFHISGRLHGSMVSEISKTRTISLNYSPKMDYFYKNIGSSSYVSIYDPDFYRKILAKINNLQSVSIELGKRAEAALMNFEYLAKYLDSTVQ
ncbi:MAG: polysaccharide pyruvyl transferase family protein [Sporolactobacillus sp.]|jgi:polysaccharide pyruvyl transferase WcaK-like protein|nr:polysaccharide pyruvyl transferase family protein [Sporolactobacillus sp.]